MDHFGKPVAFCVLLVAGTLIATGCGKGRTQEAVLSDSLVVGSWLEAPPREIPSARRAQTVAREFVRHITINADKTFVFSLRNLDGSLTKEDKKVEGTWTIDSAQNLVVLTVTNNPFKASETGYDWVPEALSEMAEKEIAGQGKTDVIYATDLTGRSAKLVRQ